MFYVSTEGKVMQVTLKNPNHTTEWFYKSMQSLPDSVFEDIFGFVPRVMQYNRSRGIIYIEPPSHISGTLAGDGFLEALDNLIEQLSKRR